MPHSEDNYPRYQQVASYIHTQYSNSDFLLVLCIEEKGHQKITEDGKKCLHRPFFSIA